MNGLAAIGFDADDTLWQNERFFRLTEARFVALLEAHGEGPVLSRRLLEAEIRNLRYYGFGIKGFTLSMIETALDVTEGRVDGAAIRAILDFGREMLDHPVETLPYAREVLEGLKGRVRLILVTKGDLFDQERKLAASGLGEFFDAVEIVSDKLPATYERIFRRHGEGAGRALMVGNSLKSDILPALAAGAFAVHVPHELTWDYERAEAPADHPRFRAIADLSGLDAAIAELLAAQ
ncbi:haloacid dehalogenase [Aureimonas endophytica]|uniref:Haloacid dehalogenase n=1 Tax=Aureimonas endophytica TaxID=2027858 RepID=A0A916ZQR9_9HYPH|nr:HAD family hydrolase [Aureimonas endophytica]GGE08333.1 haloacid dehalogenase [Aureimonas endophytica]